MKEYELYLPRNYNDGSPIEKSKLRKIKETLAEEFGGVTEIRPGKKGWWKSGASIYRDKIVIFRVLAGKHSPSPAVL